MVWKVFKEWNIKKKKGYFIEGGVLTPLPTMIILCIQGCPIREYLAKAFSPFHVI